MKKALAAVGCLFVLWAILSIFPTVAQIPQFPQNLPPNSVVGRTGITAGPAQAIPFSQLFPLVIGGVAPGSLTNNMLASMPANSIKGAVSAGSPIDLTPTQVKTIIGERFFNVVADFGADPTGTLPFDAAFNMAMAACTTSNAGPIPAPSGTVYIPQGRFSVASGLLWQSGCNIVADPSAHIVATGSINSILASGQGVTNTLVWISLTGGIWDCNQRATNGFVIPDFLELRLHDFRIFNCGLANGGDIALGANGSLNQNGIYISNAALVNEGASITTPNIGIYTNGTLGTANDAFINMEIVGHQKGIAGTFSYTTVNNVHTWVYGSQGCATDGMEFRNFGPVMITQAEVDGPICPTNAAYQFYGNGQTYSITQSDYFNSSNDNVTYGIFIATGAKLISIANQFNGSDSSHRITQDYTGDTSNLVSIGLVDNNVVTVQGACTALPSGGACNIR